MVAILEEDMSDPEHIEWIGWDVKMWFKRGDSSFESGVNSAWPIGVGAMTVLREAAAMRNVNLDECYDIEVTRTSPGTSWFAPPPKDKP